MAEDENKKSELEELILKEKDKFVGNSEDDAQSRKLELMLQETTSAHLKFLTQFWEEIQWNNYLYGAKEMDFSQLPVVNAYLSEWKDEDCFDEADIFKKCSTCLKIIDFLNFAISVCLYATEKQRNLWREGIKNLQETIFEKLNYLTFMLLKDGEKYLNSKTGNVEYGTKDNVDDCFITLCLWVNLYAVVRKQGMSVFGFSFKLPLDIVQKNCAVRIMHTLFNHVSPQKSIPEDKIKEIGEDLDAYAFEKGGNANEVVESTEEMNEIMKDDKESVEEQDDEAQNGNITQAEKSASSIQENFETLQVKKEKSHVPEIHTKHRLSEKNFAAFDPSLLPPLEEPEMEIVNPGEYFIVGGVFHFDLYAMPQLNVRKGNITYIHREKPKLRRIRYKIKIVPPRTLNGHTPYIVTAYEKARFRHELKSAILVQLQLPKKVMYLSTPEPVRFFPEKDGYSRDCIFCVDYKEDTKQISFKTNQFGIFGILQKKYQNFPYKKWMVKNTDAVILSLSGSKFEVDIRITNHGYTVIFLHPDDNLILNEVNSTWMPSDLLIQKLLAVGINIVLGEDAEKFADISKKEKTLEDKVYDCVALLCTIISFTSVPKCISAENEIALECITKKEGKVRRVIVRNNEVVDYEEEVKRVEKAEAALEKVKDGEKEDPSVEDLGIEGITEEQKNGK